MGQHTTAGRPTAVYRIYDAAGELLYVGITHIGPERIATHRRSGGWGSEIATVEWEQFPNRRLATRREMELIARHRPRHNVRLHRSSVNTVAVILCPLCLLEGIEEAAVRRGWCWRHYLRWWKYADPLALRWGRERIAPAVRFWAKVDKYGPLPDECPDLGLCWLWNGHHNAKGYAKFGVASGHSVSAHRFVYELMIGPIAAGLVIDHLCRRRGCVNPRHMEPVTPAENTRRGKRFQATKTHCPQGHAYDEENTYHYRGERHCIACKRARVRAWQLREKKWRVAAGENHGSAKLTWAAVDEIRATYVPRVVTYAQLAQRHGVSPSAIAFVLTGQRWDERHRPLQASSATAREKGR